MQRTCLHGWKIPRQKMGKTEVLRIGNNYFVPVCIHNNDRLKVRADGEQMTGHNKKRNVGVIHEQLVRYIGNAIINKDNDAAERAVAVITKHFKPGTELHREFRLFNALINVPMSNAELSKRVIEEARSASAAHNRQKINEEKSQLIKSINHTLSETNFYDIRVPSYRLYATVQSLLDSWRGIRTMEITETVKYEQSLVEWLSRSPGVEIKQEAVDPLVYRLMLQKFQEKYGKSLLPEQKRVIEVALVKGRGALANELSAVQASAVGSLQAFKKSCSNSVLLEKIDRVISGVESIAAEGEDRRLERTLQLVELVSELKGEENE